MTISDWKESSFDWQETTVSATTIYSLNLLVNVYNDMDDNNTDFDSIFVSRKFNKHIIHINQANCLFVRLIKDR